MTPTRDKIRAWLRTCISGEETSLRQASDLAQQMNANDAVRHHTKRLALFRAALAALDDADTLHKARERIKQLETGVNISRVSWEAYLTVKLDDVLAALDAARKETT